MTTMDTDRKQFLRRALTSQLEAVVPESADGRTRVKWLGEQLHNYVERWLAFQTWSSQPAPPTGNDDLFVMMEVGAELLGEEMGRAAVPTNIAMAWRAFLGALEHLRRASDSERQGCLRETLAAVLFGLSK
jgi:hypothetical protein